MNSVKGWIVVFAMLMSIVVYAQDDDDTVRTKPYDRYWTKDRFVPRVGIGTQDLFFVEAGMHWQTIYKNPLISASHGPYATVDMLFENDRFILGPKIGYEMTFGVIATAVDVSHLIDISSNGNKEKAWAFTPKIGGTILGFATLYYGYQIPISENEIGGVNRNRFTLIFNLNRDYLNLKEAQRKRKSY
jgi:hypothetical protein